MTNQIRSWLISVVKITSRLCAKNDLSSEQPCAEDILCSTKQYKILEIRKGFISVAAVTASRLH